MKELANKMEISSEETLKTQLIYAQEYINKLEKHLSEQKVEMKRCKESMKRRRRPGMQSSFRNKFQYVENADMDIDSIYEESSDISSNLFVLKIENVETSSEDNSASFYFNSLCDKVYLVGCDGVTIGSGQGCGIRLPSETGVSVYHAAIKFDDDKQKFNLLSYPQKKTTHIEDLKKNEQELKKEDIEVGFTFTTGILQWKVYGLSPIYAMISSLYATAKRNDLISFDIALDMYISLIGRKKTTNNQKILDDIKCWDHVTDNFEKRSKNKGLVSLLQIAVKYNSPDIVQRLIKFGVNIDLQNGEEQLTALHTAIMDDNYEMTRLILQCGADLDICDTNGRSPLSMAVSHKIRKLLLDCIMICSASYGNDIKEVERILRDTDVPVGCKAFRGSTPLVLACKYGSLPLVNLLLTKNPDVNAQCGYMCQTSLHVSVLRDDIDVVRLLLSHGADTNIVDRCGYTAEELIKSLQMRELFTQESLTLCSAVQCGDIVTAEHILTTIERDVDYTIPPEEVCRRISTHQLGRKDSVQLLKKNAGMTPLINQKNGRGLAPIHLAAASGNIDLIYLLASYGANMEIAGGLERWTPLFFAVLCHQKEAVKTLLQLGADKEYCFAHGRNCKDHLDHVIKVANVMSETMNFDTSCKDFEYIIAMIPPQFLVKPTYDIKCANDLDALISSSQDIFQILSSSQEKMLKVLKERDTEGLLKLLDQKEVDVNELLDKTLQITPLDYAASIGMNDMVNILLMNNADPTIDDPKGYTPLHTAVESGHANIVETFLKFNVNVNIETRYERYTPLHVAAIHNRKKIIEILLEHGCDTTLKDTNQCKAFDLSRDEIIQRMLASPEEHFYLAILQNDLSLVIILLETSPNINQYFRNGLTPLHVAVKMDHLDMATFLINNGADVNAQDCCAINIGTPLHYACVGDLPEMAKLLLENSASHSIENKHGKSPYEVSSSNKIRWVLAPKFQRPSPDNITDRTEESRDPTGDENLCAICRDNKINVIVLPCRHQAFCVSCITQRSECALCRNHISSVQMIS